MDAIPFCHSEQIFNIFVKEDLTFQEVRAILDVLLARNAFDPAVQAETGRYEIRLEEQFITVWVAGLDVYISKQT
jgi:hypothetical protein